jgi:hypothetical protein
MFFSDKIDLFKKDTRKWKAMCVVHDERNTCGFCEIREKFHFEIIKDIAAGICGMGHANCSIPFPDLGGAKIDMIFE